MIELNIPGRGRLVIKNLVLDLNGTIAFDGEIIEGVRERLHALSQNVDIFVVTADTKGKADQALKDIKGGTQKRGNHSFIKLLKIEEGEEDFQKLEILKRLGTRESVCIGNGSNDAYMLKESIIGICIAGREGAAIEAIMNADLVIYQINDALDLLLVPERIVASLRK